MCLAFSFVWVGASGGSGVSGAYCGCSGFRSFWGLRSSYKSFAEALMESAKLPDTVSKGLGFRGLGV